MSNQSQIDRLKTIRNSSLTEVEAKGVSVPAGSKLEALPGLIRAIPKGFFPSLLITAPAGSNLTITNGAKTFTGVATGGEDKYGLPTLDTWTVTARRGGNETSETVVVSQAIEYKVKLNFTAIYGAEWDGTATTKWARTDKSAGFSDPTPALNNGSGSSPFDDLMPWSGMKRVSDPACGEVVEIPRYWFKWTKSGKRLKLQIADGPVPGFHVSPGHADRGDGKGERSKIYVGRYHCAGSGWRSQTGQQPHVNVTRPNANSGVHTLGGDVWLMDWATIWTLRFLYLVEFADWNSQKTIGMGCGNNSSVQAMGYTDGMKYHTGTTQGSRSTGGLGTQYRWIEGLWDNCSDWLGGCYYNGSGLNVILNPAKYSDSSGGVCVGKPVGGYSSKFDLSTKPGYEWCIWPTKAKGNDSTYLTDYWDFVGSNPCLRAGGDYSQSGSRGICYLYCNSASDSYDNIGCRLQKLP